MTMEGICETGPTVYPRRLQSLTICWCSYKGSTFYSVILRPWVMVRPESNSRPPTWQTDAHPAEPPVRHGHTMVTFFSASLRTSAVMLTWRTWGMYWTKPSLTSHLSEIPNNANSVSVSKDSTKLYSDRTNMARCCETKFVHSLIMRLELFGTFWWYGSFPRPRSCTTKFPTLSLKSANVNLRTYDANYWGSLLFNDSRASHSSRRASDPSVNSSLESALPLWTYLE